jgi:hypothetical protein
VSDQNDRGEEVTLSQYGHVVGVDPLADEDAYLITNSEGKQWHLSGQQAEAGKKGTPVVRFMVAWFKRDSKDVHYMGHTAKPTALAHVRGLKRDPRVEGVAIYPVTGEEP